MATNLTLAHRLAARVQPGQRLSSNPTAKGPLAAGFVGSILLILGFGTPLLLVFLQSFTQPGPQNYSIALSDSQFIRSMVATGRLALEITLFSLLVGYPYAYVLAKAGGVLRTILFGALMVSFWTSLLVRTYAWQVLLNNTGLINKTLEALGIIQQPLPLIRTEVAVVIGMVHILSPFAVLAIFAQLRSRSNDLELAAQSMGARPITSFWRITFPLSLPGVAAGGLLVFILTLGYYVTPSLLGGPRDVMVGQSIVLQVQEFLKPGVGAAMAVILLLAVLIVLATAGRFIRIGKILGVGENSEQ